MAKLYLYTDGGSRGNPGPSAIGGICERYDDRRKMVTVFVFSEVIEDTTNNVAEYKALIKGLSLLKNPFYEATEVEVYMDSELIVRQLSGQYRCKASDLIPLNAKAQSLMIQSKAEFTIKHIPRHLNQRADTLVNRALDMRGDRG